MKVGWGEWWREGKRGGEVKDRSFEDEEEFGRRRMMMVMVHVKGDGGGGDDDDDESTTGRAHSEDPALFATADDKKLRTSLSLSLSPSNISLTRPRSISARRYFAFPTANFQQKPWT